MKDITTFDTKAELPKNFYLNKQIKDLHHYIGTTLQSVILTGKAGTGKSTFVEYLRNFTNKKIQILAFTGIAAIKGRGRTIHSFFKLPHRIPNKKKDYKKLSNSYWINDLDIIVIDEISMVRADLLDAIDRSLRLNRKKQIPFGGVQMLFVGDVFQMPPVITGKEREVLQKMYPDGPFFFNAKSFKKLKTQYIDADQVLFEHHSFPLDLAALNAEKMLRSVRNKEKSFQLLSKIYEKQNQWAVGSDIVKINKSLKKIGLEFGLENKIIENYLKDENIQDQILNERIKAQKNYKIESTPTIYINKNKYEGDHNFKSFKKAIDKLL